MMKIHGFKVLLLALFLGSCSSGPDYTLLIKTSNPGVTAVYQDSLINLEPIMMLDDNHSLINIPEGVYIEMADAEGVVSQFGQGSYSFSKIKRSFYKNADNHKPLPKKYVEYIWNEITYAKEEGEGKFGMKPTVLRFNPIAFRGDDQLITPEPMEIISGTEVNFTWNPFGFDEEYLLIIKEEQGDWSQVNTLTDTTYTLDASKLNSGSFYRVKLQGGGQDRLFFFQNE